MNKQRILIPLAILVLIPLARFLWFYQGTYLRPSPIETPDYHTLSIDLPEKRAAETFPGTAKNASDADTVVLFDTAHDNLFLMSEIETLTNTLEDSEAQIILGDSDHTLEEYLKFVNAFVVISPTSVYSDSEMQAIANFVERGGQLLVINDPVRSNYEAYDTSAHLYGIDVTNLLLAPFDIAYQDDYVYNLIRNEGNFRNIYLNHFSEKSSLTSDLSEIVFYGAHSLQTLQPALINGDDDTLSSLTDEGGELVMAATASRGDGSVLVLGDMNFLSQAYYQVADNHQFIVNIANFLLSGTNKPELQDIPYLFERPVTVLMDSDTLIDNDLLETLTETQTFLDNYHLPLQISESPTDGNDLLILGTFPPNKQLREYVEPFDIDFDIRTTDDPSSELEEAFPEKTAAPTAETPDHTEESAVEGTPNAPIASPTAQEKPEIADTQSDASEEEGSVSESGGLWQLPDMDREEDAIIIPGLGQFSAKGIGLVMFSPDAKRNTLILMTASTRSLGDFTYDILHYGDLSGCLIKDNLAVCSIDSDYADYEESGDESENDEDESGFDVDFLDELDFNDDY